MLKWEIVYTEINDDFTDKNPEGITGNFVADNLADLWNDLHKDGKMYFIFSVKYTGFSDSILRKLN